MKKEKIAPEAEQTESAPKKKRSVLGTVAKLFTALVVVLVLFWFGFTTVVREGSCAVILRFGAVREEVTQAGVYLKLPWPFEEVITYDNRTQYLESNKLETTTADKRNIMLQSFVTWQIDEPLRYHNSVGAKGSAETFIRSAVDSATNKILGTYSLSQLVSLEAEQIRIGQIQQEIFDSVRTVCQENYGISVSDVSILRISLPDTNLESVFQQMTADRQKEIDTILADARLEATKITTDAAQQSSEIIAQGVKDAAEIKAQTEMEVAQIYAEAQAANLELYQFLMDLNTLSSSVGSSTVLVVKADEYPFNILTRYSQSMVAEGDETVIKDLSYILTQLEEPDRQALIDAISQLIRQAAQ
ncbi:MAG: protease modulator HflC [Ruminococcaceae bacterium]|nr:protease modulator HflC [Oscillospiraceae bacterium]